MIRLYDLVESTIAKKGYTLESQTDIEVIAKLIKYLFDRDQESHTSIKLSFPELVERTVRQLEGAYALVFKSSNFPNQCIATRRGSPLLIGVKSDKPINVDQIPFLSTQQLNSEKANSEQQCNGE
ncbi:glutamine--fructose-6-phosphate aminotransferase [isomerizing] 1-like [Hydra vulgaris]|uniref:glutamine--fructose-6-phosphate aminotransferase [isomerizing] 1-like n=1 Tax=Hydra vulgaris TaxID=6087 RepID=UPI0032EA4FF1